MNINNVKAEVLNIVSRAKVKTKNDIVTIIMSCADRDKMVEFLELLVSELEKLNKPTFTPYYTTQKSKEPGLIKQLVGLFW